MDGSDGLPKAYYMASITFSDTDTAHLSSRSPAELGLSTQPCYGVR